MVLYLVQFLTMSELKSETDNNRFVLIPEVSMGSSVDLACSETALGQCSHFAFRVVQVEIM